MKQIIYILNLIFSVATVGQSIDQKKDFRVHLVTIEKKTKDTLAGSIIEIYSGNKRIKTNSTDFDGVSIFYLNPKDIIDNNIYLIIHGLKCKPYKKKFFIQNDLNTTIYLKYGKTEYNNPKQTDEMFKKFDIKPDFGCGTVD
jgi:hypothetical protein